MSKIFLSYRRSDGQDVAGRIYDSLAEHFSKECVFKDVDSIPLGRDFRRVLEESVLNAEVVLVVIGPGWLSAANADGARRLDDPADFVRVEVESALQHGKPIIPVTIANAKMMAAADLPASLQDLAFHNGIAVRPDPDFHHDIVRLIAALEKLSPKLRRHSRKPMATPARRVPILVSLCAACGLIFLAAIIATAFLFADEWSAVIAPVEMKSDPQLPKLDSTRVILEPGDAKKLNGSPDLKTPAADGGLQATITTDVDGKATTIKLSGTKKKKIPKD